MAPITFLHKKIHKKKTLLIFLQSYALLLILGGVFAHTNHFSSAVIASVLSGMAIQAGAWLVYKEKKCALSFNLISILGLTLFFIYRWFLVRKFYPPAFLVLVSLLLVFKICQALYEYKKFQKISA